MSGIDKARAISGLSDNVPAQLRSVDYPNRAECIRFFVKKGEFKVGETGNGAVSWG